ncbi:NADPH-dependent 7-cyano-7-deazaguanine reductase QueF [Simiduia sp. 21SJ11W-1]|uniref:NADPH-dependent 7-cyano-7-deazaguanine reductase QueF n=1 Tax=Simiduia sp. 21SJ11W-1 TaxID=2909669 RepID=UPI0020A02A5F|nr:NADPH-dependent 7-cyano-7-deazaguanine reductase QueF [Simiduia sp. 21SJ11W-1]UTA46555.1 NADPH-dependent 7-cyano-7-deazaguanine reductase QueF [Simiduia sp. 21SJ11W-1]
MSDNPVEKHGPSYLGKTTDYVDQYEPGLLDPIPRSLAREALALDGALPFTGVDRWTGYEVSWLNRKGLPQVAVAEFEFPCTSPNIVESKSFKLYLNSFNQTAFGSVQEVVGRLEEDLSAAAGAPVLVQLMDLRQAVQQGVGHFTGVCLDDQDVSCSAYTPAPELLALAEGGAEVHETLYSDLLKSNCPVTGQPDWASIVVEYAGPAIDRAGLLQYIVSFRNHRDFHEHCVERIFLDISKRLAPRELTVYARYTRRGGLDINPYRTNCEALPEALRLVRQ